MGVRAGQGYGAAKPKRMMCPRCGKQGLKLWRAVAGAAGASVFRDCQYCNGSVAIGNAYRALARHLRRAVVQRGWLRK